jgi:hypothetical protein
VQPLATAGPASCFGGTPVPTALSSILEGFGAPDTVKVGAPMCPGAASCNVWYDHNASAASFLGVFKSSMAFRNYGSSCPVQYQSL